jgi:predicted Fe-Mo cluster-binding NifX family protein
MQRGTDVVLARSMGERARELLAERGIRVILGVPDDTPEELVLQHLAGRLEPGRNLRDH